MLKFCLTTSIEVWDFQDIGGTKDIANEVFNLKGIISGESIDTHLGGLGLI